VPTTSEIDEFHTQVRLNSKCILNFSSDRAEVEEDNGYTGSRNAKAINMEDGTPPEDMLLQEVYETSYRKELLKRMTMC